MSRYLVVDDIDRFTVPEQPAISPDGERVVHVVRTNDLRGDRTIRSLWCVEVATGAQRQLTTGPTDSAPVWSPDGRQLAFLRVVSGVGQLHLLDVESGDVRALTNRRAGAAPAVFDPDGRRLAFVAPAEASDDHPVWSWGRPVASPRLDHYADGDGSLGSPRRHVHVVDLSTGECRQVTDGDWSAANLAWSPEGSRLAFTAGMSADADLTRTSAVYVIDPDDGASTPRLAGTNAGTVGPLAWAAAGVLLVCGHEEGTGRFIGLLRVCLGESPTRNLTESLDRQVMYGAPGYPGSIPRVVAGRDSVLFCLREGGYVRPYQMRCAGGPATPLLDEAEMHVSALTVAGDRVAFLGSSSDSVGEVYVLDLDSGQPRRLTRHHESLGELRLAGRTQRTFTISDGTTVEGWLMRDPAASGPQPLLVDIHGGPHNAWNGAAEDVHLYHHELVGNGWTILLLNPRGSDGYGEAFSLAVRGRWGLADTNDFLEPVDELINDGLVDRSKVAVTGFSYGGYMTCYLTSRTDRFAAAVGGGVISDLVSAAGTTDNRRGLTVTEWGGPFWENQEAYAAMSPLRKVADVRTPTLLLHGGDDVRCPLGQARQWHTALRELGVPTEIVTYPNASHNMLFNSPPSVRRDYNARVVDWLRRFVG